jgi:hypothetical protein
MASKKKTVNLLPEYLRTDKNSKFLSATVDQLINTPELERIDGYIGSKITPNYNPAVDFYLKESLPLRTSYSLEPAMVFKDKSSKINDVISYDDLINELQTSGSSVDNLDRIFRTKFYSYDPLIDWDKLINYNQYYWLPTGPNPVLIDAEVDVEAEIIGQSSYVTDKINSSTGEFYTLTNGLAITFDNATDSSYNSKVYIVEGVGKSIKLIDINLLDGYEGLARVLNETFDSTSFDDFPFDADRRLPLDPEYITINRSSRDLNPWSRYNRWFHIDVIKMVADISGTVPVIPLEQRAKRPIIEFKPNIQLFNFGKTGIENVDLIDSTESDALNVVHGAHGYYIDGVLLQSGHRVIFNADKNQDVKRKIYRVEFTTGVSPVIQLEEEYTPSNLDSVSVNFGKNYTGTSWVYNDSTGVWAFSQQHTALNQPPLFDLHDNDGVSYTELTTSFLGNKIFGYDVGTGSKDSVLGFPLKYQNSVGVGSYLFKNYFMTDNITVVNKNESNVIPTSITYIKVYDDQGNESLVNVWQEAVDYQMPILEVQTVNETTSSLTLTCLNKPIDINLSVSAYINDVKLETTTYATPTKVVLFFDEPLEKNQTVLFKVLTSNTPNSNGYYETPLSLTNNPLNGPVTDMTLSELSAHVYSMTSRIPNVDPTNLRDLTDYSKYGTRLIVSSNPISFSQIFFGKKEHNLVDALRSASNHYSQFKSVLLKKLYEVDSQTTPAESLDRILKDINLVKDSRSLYYRSDMLGYGDNKIVRSYTVTDSDNTEFPIGLEFDLSKRGYESVLVYLNDNQLTNGKEYEFNYIDGTVILSASLNENDVVDIHIYNSTLGSYVPATPSKLGLYPKFVPEIYEDNSYASGPVTMIRGHDGSVMRAYGDYRDDIILEFEKRVYNNIKVQYNSALFDIMATMPGAFRNSKFSLQEANDILVEDFTRWAGLNNIDTVTNSTFDEGNAFTWNFKNTKDLVLGKDTTGTWRALYRYYYDTDRPHTHPWEMLGHDSKPAWWDDYYSWTDFAKRVALIEAIETGLTQEPPSTEVNSNYARPGIATSIPVDLAGNLLSPDQVLVGDISYVDKKSNWLFGDMSPAETAWRHSSYWPFVSNIFAALADPCTYASRLYDVSRTYINSLGQVTYLEDDLYLDPRKLLIDGENDVQVVGYGLYVVEVGKQKDINYVQKLRQDIDYLDVNLFHKLGGFTSKEKLQIIIDSLDPVSTSPGVILPPEDYSLILNVSNPIKSSRISGIIVQKANGKFVVKGYDISNPYFEIYRPIRTATSGAITVGGVSEQFTDWMSVIQNGNSGLSSIDTTTASANTSRYYKQGQIVRYNNKFYRVKIGHAAQTSFDPALFIELESLPMKGGARALLASKFESTITRIPYGTEFSTIQEVYDLIVGYGEFLEKQGFIFEEHNGDLGEILNWKFTAKEFLYWTTQNWADGNLITLSPFADKIKYRYTDSVVDNVYSGKYEYSLLKADGKSFPVENFRLTRDDGVCTIETLDTEDGLFFAVLNSIQKEHAFVFNNSTVFNDTIYDLESGYKQRRMKLSGFRTKNWNGDLFSPGFVYDSVDVVDWKSYTSYLPGDVVRYNGSYYESLIRINNEAKFDFSKWVKLPEKPEPDLLPNFDYKITQFEDFYSLDIDNFDIGQQRLAQHLVGYTPRTYLNNLFTNPTSQYKFYQGFIKEKGTRNAVDKLSKASQSANKGIIEISEEWAFRVGHYGGFETYKELEFSLEEGTSLENPYLVSFVDAIPENIDPLVNYVTPSDLLLSKEDYVPSQTFITAVGTFTDNNIELLTAGYVNPDDVTATAYGKPSLLDIANNNIIRQGNTFWVGFLENGGWSVYRYARKQAKIAGVFVSSPGQDITFTTDSHHNLKVGDLISVVNFNDQVNGVYVVSKTPTLSQFTVPSELTSIENEELLAYGALFKFDIVRYADFAAVAETPDLLFFEHGEKFWVDQGLRGKWQVYEKIKNYSASYVESNDYVIGQQLGRSVFASDNTPVMFVSAPNWSTTGTNGFGRIKTFTKIDGTYRKDFEYTLNSGLTTYASTTATSEFGYALTYDIAKGLYFAGAPASSNVKYSGSTGSVVISTGSESPSLLTSQGLVKISSNNRIFEEELTEAVLVSPNPTTNERFGHSIYVNQVSVTTSTLLLVGAPGTGSIRGNVYSYLIDKINPVTGIVSTINTTTGPTITLTLTSVAGLIPEMTIEKISGTGFLPSSTKIVSVTTSTNEIVVQVDSAATTGTIVFNAIPANNYKINAHPSGITVATASTATGDKWGYKIAGTPDGSIIAISAPNRVNTSTTVGLVQVFSNTNNVLSHLFNIESPLAGINSNFGYDIAISDSGKYLIISAPEYKAPGEPYGKVLVYKKDIDQYTLWQSLANPVKYQDIKFGYAVSIDKNEETIVIGSLGVNRARVHKFDTSTGETVFDNDVTRFIDAIPDSGEVYIYDKVGEYFIPADELSNDRVVEGSKFGISVVATNDTIFVGAPATSDTSFPDDSKLFIFDRINTSSDSWSIKHQQDDLVDTTKIGRIALIDNLKEEIVEYLDVIDPLKGKVAGIAEQELKFKTAFDPAVYSFGTAGTINDTTSNWLDEHIGELWWDLSTAKYVWYEQGSDIFRKNNWGRLFPGATIDVYEWVKSDVLPSEWAAQADTNEGLTRGISGQPKYPDNSVVSVKQVYNNVTNSFENVYYFWVKNKTTLPDVKNRRISSLQVASIIADPVANGLKFVEILSANSIAFANVQPMLTGSRINANITIDSRNNLIPRHTEWILLNEGDSRSLPTAMLEKKFIDSLLGHDGRGSIVPDPSLSEREKYGISVRPRQSMFKDRLEALRNLITFSNSILLKNRIRDNYSFENLNKKEEIPSVYSREYDLIVEDASALDDVSTINFKQAVLSCVVQNGKIYSVTVIDPGLGYLNPPSIRIISSNNSAQLNSVIDNDGRVISVEIFNPGAGYADSQPPVLEVRPHSVIVQINNDYDDRWTKHHFNYELKTWVRVKTQAYNTPLFWDYVDWSNDSYDRFKSYREVVDDLFDLAGLTNILAGDYIKVKNIGTGRYAILERVESTEFGNFTPLYDIVFSEKGTIQLSENIWNYDQGKYAYDRTTLEETLYDQVPDAELYYILMALKNDIFVGNLKANWNLFFFAGVKYALTEQKLLDWAFKTSFINVINITGSLDQRPVYKLDNEEFFESYIREVKPYRTHIRNYTSAYGSQDVYDGQITDFDLPAYFNTLTQKSEVIEINSLVPKSQFTVTNTLTNVYPWKHWADNYTYEVNSIIVADGGTYYTQKPIVTITTASGDYGSGATADAFIRGGSVYKVVVTNPGSGYIIPPVVSITGGGNRVTRPATVSVVMSNNKIRKNTIGMRFDRISKEVEIANHDVVDTFVCPGNQNSFVLSWLADYDKLTIVPTLDGKVVLSTDYTLEYYTAPYAGYNKRYSKFVFLNAVPEEGQILTIRYKKNLDLYNAIDRIERYYKPDDQMPGKDYPLLMTGLEYPQTELQGLKFEDTPPWGTASFDSSPWGDLVTSFADAKLVTTASNSDTVLYLSTTTGIVPGQVLSVISTSTGSYFRKDTIIESVNTATSSVTIFSPSYRIKKASAAAITTGSLIEFITYDNFNGNFRGSDTVYVSGISTPGYDGQYQIYTCTNNKFWVLSNGVLASTTGTVTSTATGRVYSILTTIPAISNITLDRVLDSSTGTSTVVIETYALVEDVVTATVVLSTSTLSTAWTIQSSNHDPARAHILITGLTTSLSTLIDVTLYGNTSLEFWGNNTDYRSLDSAITGGTWQGDSLSGALGVNPEDIIIDGDKLINPNSSHAPEEFVPGHVLDSLGINVYTQPETTSPSVMTFSIPLIAGQKTTWPLPAVPENPMAIMIYFNGTTFQKINNPDFFGGNYFTLQGTNLIIGAQEVSGLAFCTLVFVGADTQVDSGITLVDKQSTTTNSGTVVSLFDFYDVKSVYVTLNGDQINPYTGVAPGYLVEPYNELNHRATVRVILPPDNKKYNIEAWFFKEPYPKFNRFYQETQYVDSTSTARTFVLSFPPRTVEPASNQAIVEYGSFFDLTRLRPPSTSYYRVEGDEVTFDIDNKRVQSGVHSLNTVKVYLNGVELRPGFDWTINSGADTVTVINGLLTPGDVVAVLSLLEYDYFISGNLLTTTNPIGPDQIIKVSTFPDQDNMFVRTERFERNAANEYTLSLPVINENYVWVSAGSQYLNSGYEFSLLQDMRTIRIADTVVVDPGQEIIITSVTPPRAGVEIIGYRIFKDIFENQSYKRLSKYHTAELESPLSYLDTEIRVKNANTLAHPNPELNLPGVIIIDAERIEYFGKNGNVLSELRRSTLGTGSPFYSQSGTKVIDQSVKQTINTYEQRLHQHIFTNTNTVVISTTTATGYAFGDGIELTTPVGIQSLSSVDSNIFATLNLEHSWYKAGDKIVIQNVSPSFYNGVYVIDQLLDTGINVINASSDQSTSTSTITLVSDYPHGLLAGDTINVLCDVPLASGEFEVLDTPDHFTIRYKAKDTASDYASTSSTQVLTSDIGRVVLDVVQSGGRIKLNSISTMTVGILTGTVNVSIAKLSYHDPIDQVEVYYGGRKLRKTSLLIHDKTVSYDTSTESLSILEPEFSINTSTQELTLNIDEEITTATRITVVQRKGAIWTRESLLTSDVQQAKFLRARPAEFPDSYYYGGATEITDENIDPLSDDSGTLQGF